MPDKLNNLQQHFFSMIRSLEKKRNSQIFCIVQDLQREHLCKPQMSAVLKNRDRFKGSGTLEILIHSNGGHADIAYRLARYFRNHCDRLNVIVPFTAKSAATLMCLAADKIYMGELAELGPLDVQITDELEKGKRPFSPLDEFKSMDFLREYAADFLDYFVFALKERGMSVKQALHEAIPAVTGMMSPLYSHIDPSKVGSYRRSLAEGEEYARRLLDSANSHFTEDLVELLVWKYPDHTFVIDRMEAHEIGLPVQPLDIRQEKQLLAGMADMISYGVPFYGFVPEAKAKTPAAKKAKRTAVIKKLPKPAASGSGLAASVRAGA